MKKTIVTVLKKKRTQLRASITKLIKTTDEEIEKSNVNYEEVEVNIELLEGKFHLLSTTDDELIKNFKPEEADREFNSSEDYRVEKSERQLSGVGGTPVREKTMTRERAATPRSPSLGSVINRRDEISPEASPSVNPDDPVPVFPLTIPDDPVPVFPVAIPDDPDPEERDP
ncbi:hypothetical protein TNIN_495431 [Trichonephila inaurata madagascariensis]|uniref:Uncharacterized protein n=1 Tax=Trichonephila inaurata madagascariensis TaxID=2747483 RepID=A0A8X6Y1G0_9ARAC|nr:hypothetical protein TNIN_495431 [Trichonephila inaurata madagascariensis]